MLDKSHWQYQRILLREELDPDGKVLEAVHVKLGFGVHSVSAQSEEAVKRIASDLWKSASATASLLVANRYVDDIAKSTKSKEESLSMTKQAADILKSKLNMSIKGWAIAGQAPPPEISKDGVSVDLGGNLWFTQADLYTLNNPPLCFEKKKRGKLPDNAVHFDPKTMNLNDFVPNPLTRKMVTSVLAKVWDIKGKLAPISLKFKNDLRNLIKETPEWDQSMSDQARALWIQNFSIMEETRSIVYVRCNKPPDALRDTCRIWVVVDAAEWAMMVSAYVGWERVNGTYSCSHLFGKGLLGPEALTLPQKELHVLNVGANIVQLLSVVLEEWVEEILIAGDSEISLCWVLYETVKLNQFNRVRVINIASKINLDNLFHVKGTENPADIGTRVCAVSSADVQTGSDYLCGKSWMKLNKEDAIKSGAIKPAARIKLDHDQKKVLKKGIVYDSFEKEDSDIIGVLMVARINIDKVAERESIANYVYSPLLRSFLSFVDIVAVVLKAAQKFSPGSTMSIHSQESRFSISQFYSETMIKGLPGNVILESDRNKALEYIFQTETKIVKHFHSSTQLEKFSIEENNILYCKSRLLEGQTVKVVGGLKIDSDLKGLFNLNFKVPIIDHNSPLAYSLALHLHSLFNHRGIETCYRLSLNYVKILGGKQIFKNIAINCVICLKDRKKYLKMIMGGLSDAQVTISPTFYYTMLDMFGPLKAFCPGYEKTTRRDKSYEVYFLVFCCVATGCVNVQLIEGKKTDFILDGFSRFFNECCIPKIMFPDDDGALVKAISQGEICIEDLSGSLYKTRGILFQKCSPQGHSSHGKVERLIRSLQQSFNRSGASSSRCTATGWSTIGKAMERQVNSIPIGFLFDNSVADGNPVLRVLKPCSLKGLNAGDRAPKGLFSIPDLAASHFTKVEEAYNLWAKCWATSYVPLIMKQQKWHEEDPNLQINDIVYFKIEDSPVSPSWRIGKVDSVRLGRDNRVRNVNISYKILKEDKDTWTHSVVTRPVREIIKLFELNDTTYAEEVKAAYDAAKNILIQNGEIVSDFSDYSNQKVNGQFNCQTDEENNAKYELDNVTGTGVLAHGQQRQSLKPQQRSTPFLSTLTRKEWHRLEGVHGTLESRDDELVLLL